jgi:hypothetical protein
VWWVLLGGRHTRLPWMGLLAYMLQRPNSPQLLAEGKVVAEALRSAASHLVKSRGLRKGGAGRLHHQAYARGRGRLGDYQTRCG